MSIVETLVANAKSAATKLRVRSALNPMLWMCGIVSPLSFGFAFVFRANELICLIFILIGSLPILATIRGFFYFMTRCPEKLQSEDFQLRHQSLEIIKQSGTQVELTPSSLEAITNTSHRKLNAKG